MVPVARRWPLCCHGMAVAGIRPEHQQQQEQPPSPLVVYVGTMPLRLPPGPALWALSTVDRLGLPPARHLQHFYTLLQHPSPGTPCMVFDFQPSNPEDLHTAFVALAGGRVDGVVLERKISKLPAGRCWKVGTTRNGLKIEDALDFNKNWDSQLQLWKHDCRDYTNGLVEFLTGERQIVQKVMSMSVAEV